jgi:hypothetical protein
LVTVEPARDLYLVESAPPAQEQLELIAPPPGAVDDGPLAGVSETDRAQLEAQAAAEAPTDGAAVPLEPTAEEEAQQDADDYESTPVEFLETGDALARYVEQYDAGDAHVQLDTLEAMDKRMIADGLPLEQRGRFWEQFCADRGLSYPSAPDSERERAAELEREQERLSAETGDPRYDALAADIGAVKQLLERQEYERHEREAGESAARDVRFHYEDVAGYFQSQGRQAPEMRQIFEVWREWGMLPGRNIDSQSAIIAAVHFLDHPFVGGARAGVPQSGPLQGGAYDPKRNPRGSVVIPGGPSARQTTNDDDPLDGAPSVWRG